MTRLYRKKLSTPITLLKTIAALCSARYPQNVAQNVQLKSASILPSRSIGKKGATVSLFDSSSIPSEEKTGSTILVSLKCFDS